MRILIVEDETHAAEHLERLLGRTQFDLESVEVSQSIASTVKWLTTNPAPDLLFMDIQLSDGISFSIFELIEVEAPVVFTTAYDQYALDAFKVNSIDYLLKPIALDDLEQALQKWRKHHRQTSLPKLGNTEIRALLSAMKPVYKQRFLVKAGHHLRSIHITEIQYFISSNKITYLFHSSNRKYAVDYSLTELENILNPNEYFRVNRQAIISYQSIKDVISMSNSRLKIKLKSDDRTLVVSRERVSFFRSWLDR